MLLLHGCCCCFFFCFVYFSFFSLSRSWGCDKDTHLPLSAPPSPKRTQDTVAHWLEHWTHDHKVVGTSHDSSSLCWVPEKDSSPTLFLPTQVKKKKKKWVPANYHARKIKLTRLCRRSSVPPPHTHTTKNYIVESGPNANLNGNRLRALSFGFDFTFTLIYTILPPYLLKDLVNTPLARKFMGAFSPVILPSPWAGFVWTTLILFTSRDFMCVNHKQRKVYAEMGKSGLILVHLIFFFWGGNIFFCSTYPPIGQRITTSYHCMPLPGPGRGEKHPKKCTFWTKMKTFWTCPCYKNTSLGHPLPWQWAFSFRFVYRV